MKKSDLQFTDPHIEKIDFRIGEDIINTNIPISIDVESEVNQELKEAIIKLNLMVGNINDESKVITAFYFNGIIAADFKWNDEIDNPEEMLKVSGATVLLSYIRPILANLTMQAGMKPLNLPFVNFTES